MIFYNIFRAFIIKISTCNNISISTKSFIKKKREKKREKRKEERKESCTKKRKKERTKEKNKREKKNSLPLYFP